ncbi:GNAT family N-acetyltransferase [Pontixanthobacter gangjinensis]|uniref:GNAT family N-acetyltransferase n=1 Tax=Pontixanthobacter gangjinensis TaxID=1028742 RepID=A0A6I4SSH5_9SPHN|nr:GNAT family N-acetyltransferase [Pontixanthobacter gangjinensis]MXO57472.1 GNAT family N-acetyltransferase [Pontixanthobacter gangjinensis]
MLHTPARSGLEQGAFTVEAPVVTSVGRALVADWEELALAASEPNSYCEHWFINAALRHLRGDEVVRLAQVRDHVGMLIGILPLTSAPQFGRLRIANTSNWNHLQNYCGGPLVRAGYETSFWTALLDLLDGSEWADNFLSLRLIYADGPVRRGLEEAASMEQRPIHIAQSYERAILATEVSSDAYIERTIRPKKRKELRRQAKRLGELGTVSFEHLAADGPVEEWCDQYLELEAAGWKGEGGTALAVDAASEQFFREIITSAHKLGRVDFLRLLLDGRPIAMLVNLRSPPSVWSYKITYDESFARYSPGVLIELETIGQVLNDPEIERADSCAKPDHSMINSLWGERQMIEHVVVALNGPARKSAYFLCRSVDRLGATLRRVRNKNHD